MLLTSKKDKKPVLVGQIIPTFFGKVGQVLRVWKPTKSNPAGSVQFIDMHGNKVRWMSPDMLKLQFSGN